MEEYLNLPIKEVISKIPEVAGILNEYNIGCVPCSVGSCLLKDIVEIHNLSLEAEQELMAKIARIIYPDREVKIPGIQRKTQPKPGEIKYSPPIKKLVDEHVLIKKWLALIPGVIENIKLPPLLHSPTRGERGTHANSNGSGEGNSYSIELIIGGIDFIRFYADKFHHAKEEEILFKYFDESLDIIKTMLHDHETGRGHVRAILKAVEDKDPGVIIEHLNGYKELLTEHIRKEDEILYPWMDRNLSTTQVGELFAKFNEVDKKIGGEVVTEKYSRFIATAEEKLQTSKK